MEHLPDYLIEPKEWDYSFTCFKCGTHNDLYYEGKIKPYNVKQICECCGANQEDSYIEPDVYDAYRDKLAEEN